MLAICRYSVAGLLLAWFANGVLAQTSVNRDPQAVSVLSQTLNAAGGIKALTAVQDFSGTGTVTFYWANQETGSVTVQGRGADQFRMDAVLPEGVRSVLVNDGSGLVIQTDGRVETMTYQGATNLGNATFPLLEALGQYQNTAISISYVGLVNHLGNPAHDIRFQLIYPSQLDPAGLQSAQTMREIFIDPNTFLPVSILDSIDTARNTSGLSHEFVFANWQQVNGIAVPFWITESVGNQSLVTIQLTQVTFNTGLSSTAFVP
ncbi:MAG TPA: hypothetical protein VGA01_12360 [Candidatus Binatia bacterium]